MVPEDGAWMCLACYHQGCGRYTQKKHALAHYADNRNHRIAFNTKTMSLWCYKCDIDIVEEGLAFADQNSRTDSASENDYKDHVENLHEFLSDLVGQKHRALNESSQGSGTYT